MMHDNAIFFDDETLKSRLKGEVSDRVREVLHHQRLNASNQASQTGISQRFMQQILAGKSLPGTITLWRMWRTFNVSMDWLVTGHGPAPGHAASSSADTQQAHEAQAFYDNDRLTRENQRLSAELTECRTKLLGAYEQILKLKNGG